LSDSEFLPVWKKYPGAADTMIKAELFEIGKLRICREIPALRYFMGKKLRLKGPIRDQGLDAFSISIMRTPFR
jgi:hypothetical protein